MNFEPQFAALADPTRRRVLELLVLRAQSVRELAEQLPVSRPAVSQHLRALHDAGLVRFTKQGTRSVYEVNPAELLELSKYLECLWSEALHSLKQVAEATYQCHRKDE